jgi:hypothetical protein
MHGYVQARISIRQECALLSADEDGQASVS